MDEPVGTDTISAPIRRGGNPVVIALRERDRDVRFDVPMTPRRWMIGKSQECEFVLDDECVSRVHCMVERKFDGTLLLHDCGSKNGSLVDGSRVMSAELRPGAVIILGRTYLVAIGELDSDSALAQLQGEDPEFRATLDRAVRAARGNCGILVVGETGTGKELVARAIHESSLRAHGPFVAINCGAFPRDLIGAELFGHARGAFTGAVESRDGMFVEADGGTLFLDELGELPLDLQPNLLRVLETRRVRPVGGIAERSVDVRFVAATNRIDYLGTSKSALRFDLYQRIAAVTVTLPPLRHRRDDIPRLARVFIDELAPAHGPRRLLPSAIDALMRYDWPGNVRELRQTMTRAMILADGDLGADDLGLPARSVSPVSLAHPRLVSRQSVADSDDAPHAAQLRDAMARALARCGSIRAAAREIGMAKSTFADKARRFGLLRSSEDEDHGANGDHRDPGGGETPDR